MGAPKKMKVRFRSSSLPWLRALYEAYAESDLYRSDEALEHLPSDVLDGWALTKEVSDLVRRRILYTLPIEEVEECTLGNRVTWHFTKRGMAIMRAWHAAASAEVDAEETPGPHCPQCGEPLHVAVASALHNEWRI